MAKPENQIKYWRDRAKNAEELLKSEAHINSFMIRWLKKVHPKIHEQMADYYKQQSHAKLKSLFERRAV